MWRPNWLACCIASTLVSCACLSTMGQESPSATEQEAIESVQPSPLTQVAEPGDWRAAGDGALADVVRSHWVSLTADGRLSGRISTFMPGDEAIDPAPVMRVHFIQSGRIVGDATTDSDGMFQIASLAPGVYSVIATGETGFLAFAVIVLPAENPQVHRNHESDVQFTSLQPVESSLAIEALAIGPPHRILRSLLNRYYPEMRMAYLDEADVLRYQESLEDDSIPPQDGVRGLLEARPENAIPATTVQRQTLHAGPDGKINGRILGIQRITGRPIAIRQANVFILQNDRVISLVSTDDQGIFQLSGIEAGIYGMVVGGQDGFGAVGFEVAVGTTASVNETDSTYVATVQENMPPPGNDISVAIVTDPRDVAVVVNGNGPGADGGAGGNAGFVGGTGGGGGGGGAGGSVGLAGVAAGAAAVAALAGDDDGNGFSPISQ